jgi:hypothetical protein
LGRLLLTLSQVGFPVRPIFCVLLGCAFQSALSAQTLSTLPPGTLVRVVTTQGTNFEGPLQSQTADSLWLNDRDGAMWSPGAPRPVKAVAKRAVYTIDRREITAEDRMGSGLIGAVLGGGIGYLLNGNSSNAAVSSNRGVIIGAAAAGGFVGGLLFPMLHRWIPVPKD